MEGIRRWLRLGDVERDVDDEIALYFDEAVRELEASGMSAADARQEAARRFGDERAYRRALLEIDRRTERRMRWRTRWEAARDTVKYAGRSVVRSPALSMGIVLAFALGIGANATMYATVERLLLRAPPHIAEPDAVRRLVVHRDGLGERIYASTIAYPDYLDFARTSGFEHVAAQSTRDVTIGSGESAQRVRGIFVTANYWPLMGVEPALGRFFTAAEDRFGGQPVAVISHQRWTGEYGGRADVLGEVIDFGYGPFTIVGVAPKGFTGVDLRPVDFFAPFMTAGEKMQGGTEWADERNWYWLQAIARLRPGVSVEAAEAEATAHHRAGRAEGDESYDREADVVAAPLLIGQGPNAPSEVSVARWLLGVSVIVLLIACLNVANLLLARMLRQHREISIRLALGISRARLVTQMVAEGLLLGMLGGAAALLLTLWGGTFVQRTLLPDVAWDGSMSGTVLLVVLVLSLNAGALSALVPAVQASRRDVVGGLRSAGGGITRSTARVRASLSMLQAALSVVLLVGAGLFVRSLDSVKHGEYGIDPWHTAYVSPSYHTGTVEPVERMALAERALERVERIRGVDAASMIAGIPFWSAYAYQLSVPGVDSIPRASTGGPYANVVSRDYFRVLDLDVVRGRLFDERDTRTGPPAMVLSESFAQALWPGQDPIGRCVKVDGDDSPCAEVIGTVEDASRDRLIEEVTYQYYMLFEQRLVARNPEGLLVRITGDMAPVLAAVERELLALDGRIRFVRSTSLEEMVAPEMRQWRLGAAMFSLFGLLALAVASIGLYSVLAFDVAQRVREIGLRTALGATTRTIVALVLARAMSITAAGVLIGIAIALVLAPRLEAMLHGVSARDPLTFAAAAVALGVISIVAAGLPALRAARVDPNVALRSD